MAFKQQRQIENGTIFLNWNDSDNPKAPHWKGYGFDDQGRKIDVAGWEGKNSKGNYIRLKIGPVFQPQGGRQQAPQPDRNVSDVPLPTNDDAGDSVPF